MIHEPPITVLLLDESASIRLLLRRTLEARPYRIVEAETVDEAWAQIALERPALIIMEIRLPGTNPLELCRAVRRDERRAATRILVLTTMAGEDDQTRALAAGADAVMAKPFRPAQLLALIDRLLGTQTNGRGVTTRGSHSP